MFFVYSCCHRNKFSVVVFFWRLLLLCTRQFVPISFLTKSVTFWVLSYWPSRLVHRQRKTEYFNSCLMCNVSEIDHRIGCIPKNRLWICVLRTLESLNCARIVVPNSFELILVFKRLFRTGKCKWTTNIFDKSTTNQTCCLPDLENIYFVGKRKSKIIN